MYQRVNELFDNNDIEGLLENLKPLILSSIKKYYNDYNNYDDLIQEGNLLVLSIYKEKEIESGKHFLGYVKNALRFYYLDKHKVRRETMSLNQNIRNGEGLELGDTLEDTKPNQEELILKDEEAKELRDALNQLTKNQRKIIFLFYIERKSIQDIAYQLNIKYRTVVNTKTLALKKLRENLNK